jgi:hypothetical protein
VAAVEVFVRSRVTMMVVEEDTGIEEEVAVEEEIGVERCRRRWRRPV